MTSRKAKGNIGASSMKCDDRCRSKCERRQKSEERRVEVLREKNKGGRIEIAVSWQEIKACREADRRTVRRISAHPKRLMKGQIMNKIRREREEMK